MKTVQSQKLIIETDRMTSQHFGSNSLPFRLTQRNRKKRNGPGQTGTQNRFLRISTFFLYIYFPQTLQVWFEGGILLDCLTFFFPVEEHYCNAATVNLLRRVRAMKALPSALRVRGSVWTHLSWGCCEVQTISSPKPSYSS